MSSMAMVLSAEKMCTCRLYLKGECTKVNNRKMKSCESIYLVYFSHLVHLVTRYTWSPLKSLLSGILLF